MFSDVLLTVDYDRTMTGPDSKIPQWNLEAVDFFMKNGGTFTINTCRSVSSFKKHLCKVTVNAPILMYNGSARWDKGKLTDLKLLDFDLWDTVKILRSTFPNMNLEIQGVDLHYLIDPEPAYVAFYDALKWGYQISQPGDDLGPFMKFALAGSPRKKSVATLYDTDAAEDALFDAAQEKLLELWGRRWKSTVPPPGSSMSTPRACPKSPPQDSCSRSWARRSWFARAMRKMTFPCWKAQIMPSVLPTAWWQTASPTSVIALTAPLQRSFIKKFRKSWALGLTLSRKYAKIS